jgi:putative ABC transport system permease protein
VKELPALARFLVRLLPPRGWRHGVMHDLTCAYNRDLAALGPVRAWVRLWSEVLTVRWITLRMEARRLRSVSTPSSPSRPLSLDTIWTDLSVARRTLRRSPGFTAVAVLTLALAIAGNTAIFSAIQAVLLRPLPYPDPDRLVYVWDRFEWIGMPRVALSGPEVADLRAQARLFEGFAALRTEARHLTVAGEPEKVRVGLASADFFGLVGVEAEQGRVFRPEEDRSGAPGVAVLAHGFWLRRFGGSSDVIGRTIPLDDRPAVVIGVLPPDFDFVVPSAMGPSLGADIWVPHGLDLADSPRGQHNLTVLARVRDGASVGQAQAELSALGADQDLTWHGGSGFAFTVVPALEQLAGQSRLALLLLLAAAGVVLLIAGANISTLSIARSRSRAHEASIRAVLGAGRLRLGSVALAEASLVALIGGGIGLLAALYALPLLVAVAPEVLPRKDGIAIDGGTLAFTALTVALSAVLCGAAPAFHRSKARLCRLLRRNDVDGWDRHAMAPGRNLPYVLQVALSLMLLAGAGLLVRSMVSIARDDPGFGTHGLVTFELTLPENRYPDPESRIAFVEELADRLDAVPGVEAVAGTGTLPLAAEHTNQNDARPDVFGEDDPNVTFDYMSVTAGYLSTMGINVVAGRGFTPDDEGGAPPAAIIDETFASLWPNGDAVGRTIRMYVPDQVVTVVGVARHARLHSVYEDGRPQLYLPYAQQPQAAMHLVLKTGSRPGEVVGAIRGAVGRIDPKLPVHNVRTMAELVDASTAERRFSATLMSAFALTGLLLAALGVYGVLSYAVAGRVGEIGVRMALGARRTSILGLVIGHGVSITGPGVILGLVASLMLSPIVSRFTFGLETADGSTLTVVSMIVIAVAAAASLLPALRASRVDPMTAIRRE